MSHRTGLLILIAGFLTAAPISRAQGQDTLSDAAWNADRARRAALRQKSQAAFELAAKSVDTILVTPAVINLRVGDTIPAHVFYARIVATGLTAQGDTVRVFAKTISVSTSPALEMRDGLVIVRAPGTAEVRVGAGRRLSVDDAARPLSRIPILVR